MEKLNKIIVGLECCGAEDRCLSCPYKDVGEPTDLDCIAELAKEAVELLKEYRSCLMGCGIRQYGMEGLNGND